MNAGTKVFLALFAIAVVGLAVYYGAFRPPQTGLADSDFTVDEPLTAEDETPRDTQPPIAQDSPAKSTTPPPGPATDDSLWTPTDDERDRIPQSGRSGAFNKPAADAIDRGEEKHNQAEAPTTARNTPATSSPITKQHPYLFDPLRDLSPTAPGSSPETSTPGNATPGSSTAASLPPETRNQLPRAKPETEKPTYTNYTIEEGDTMWTIAEAHFGDPTKHVLIAKANPFVDPTRLKVGQVIRLPDKNATDVVADATPKPGDFNSRPSEARSITYTVKSGDTLSAIAKAYYSDGTRWPVILEANRDTLDNDADNLQVGMKLVIPSAAKINEAQ